MALSERNLTLGRQPVLRNVWLVWVNTRLDGILRSGKRLRYSSTAASALPLQNPYTKCMSQYSTWENTKGIFLTLVTAASVPTLLSTARHWTRRRDYITCEQQALKVEEWGKEAVQGQTHTVHRTRKKITLFSGDYLRNRSTLDIGVLGYIGIV